MEGSTKPPRWLLPFITVKQPDDSGEWKGLCPIHDDDQPSASFNIEKGVWNCFAGCSGGSLKRLQQRVIDDTDIGVATAGGFVDPDEVSTPRSDRARTRAAKGDEVVTDAKVLGWAQHLLSINTSALERLMSRRGLDLDFIERWQLGWDPEYKAFTIPIRDGEGTLCNVRRYRMANKRRRSSYWSVKGMGGRRLFPESALSAEDVLLVEGELDALLATQMGLSAITATGGAGSWKYGWGTAFKGKRVTILYDADKPGELGAAKAAESILPYASEVRIARLPYKIEDDHGRDLTDWVVEDGATSEDIKQLMEEAEIVVSDKLEIPEDEEDWVDEEEPTDVPVTVLDSFNAQLSGQKLAMVATITGRRNPPFQVAEKVTYTCTMDAGRKCAVCPMMARDGYHTFTIPPEDPIVLSMIDAPESKQHDAHRVAAGAIKCNKASSDVVTYRNVEELFARPSVEMTQGEEREGEYTNRKILNVGRHNTPVNHTVRVVGTILPNPKTQRSEFLAWDLEATESSIDSFEMSPALAKELKVFQPAKDQSSLKKAGEIAREIESSVTSIYGRTELHVAFDLVYHSALGFSFDGASVDKGWLELLVVGDTRTGKSAVAEAMIRHYLAGRMVSCESASFAGIVGGLQQVGAGKEWTITWGAIPLNDRRLVVLDEISGMTTDQIAQMSSIRSSGIAQLTKIATEQTTSRTRLIWLGNPRKGRLADYTYGIHAVAPLIGNQEDIARFDLAMSVAGDEVMATDINRRRPSRPGGRYTQHRCHALIQWVWSRRSEDVVWQKTAEDAVYAAALDLGSRYTEDPPLVQAANVRMKVARIAVALAARTFSTDRTHTQIVVKREHVVSAVGFIDWLYQKKGFGYAESSRQELEDRRAAVQAMDEMSRWLRENPEILKFLRSIGGRFRRQDIEDMLNHSKEESTAIINRMWKMKMVRLRAGEIAITPALHQILRETKS